MTAPPRPHVYQAINQIVRAFSKTGIAKRHTNAVEQYQYRSVDDVMSRLGPLLSRHSLCILPRVLRRESDERVGDGGSLLISVRLLVAFDLVSSRDGSRHVITAWGEALDHGDKGTVKAMSAAFKGAMLQLFCVPAGSSEPDASTYKVKLQTPAPVEGWPCWADGIAEIINVCETKDALDRVRSTQANLLGALSRERPNLYAKIGECFSARLLEISARMAPGARPEQQAGRKVEETPTGPSAEHTLANGLEVAGA